MKCFLVQKYPFYNCNAATRNGERVKGEKDKQKASPESLTLGACRQNRENILLVVVVMNVGVTLNNREGEGEYPEV